MIDLLLTGTRAVVAGTEVRRATQEHRAIKSDQSNGPRRIDTATRCYVPMILEEADAEFALGIMDGAFAAVAKLG